MTLQLNGNVYKNPKRVTSGSFGEVFRVQEEKSGRSVILKVMNQDAMPHEIDMLRVLSKINSKQAILPLVDILDFGIVSMKTLFPFLLESRTQEEREDPTQNWIYLKGLWGSRKSSFPTAVVEILEEVNHTLAERKDDEITDTMLFELYYACLLLLQHGVEPYDLHPGNVGLYFAPVGVTYQMCGSTLILPRGSHILLFDWNNWALDEKKRSKTIPHKKVWHWVETALGTKTPSESSLYTRLKETKPEVDSLLVLWAMFQKEFRDSTPREKSLVEKWSKLVNRKFNSRQPVETCQFLDKYWK